MISASFILRILIDLIGDLVNALTESTAALIEITCWVNSRMGKNSRFRHRIFVTIKNLFYRLSFVLN
jgi:hypothetical protein